MRGVNTLGLVLEFSFEEGRHALDELIVGDVIVRVTIKTTKHYL